MILVIGHTKALELQAVVKSGINHMRTISCLKVQAKAMSDEPSTMELKVKNLKYFNELKIKNVKSF